MFDVVRTLAQSTIEALKIAPAIVVLCWNWFISAVPQLTMLLAFAYLILQITYLIWKWRIEHKDSKEDDNDVNKKS